MSWVVRIASDAREFIDGLPVKARRQVSRSIGQLEQDPFAGDVKPLNGKPWKGYYRKRSGDYRIIFFVRHALHVVDVSSVLLRSEKTYRLAAKALQSAGDPMKGDRIKCEVFLLVIVIRGAGMHGSPHIFQYAPFTSIRLSGMFKRIRSERTPPSFTFQVGSRSLLIRQCKLFAGVDTFPICVPDAVGGQAASLIRSGPQPPPAPEL